MIAVETGSCTSMLRFAEYKHEGKDTWRKHIWVSTGVMEAPRPL